MLSPVSPLFLFHSISLFIGSFLAKDPNLQVKIQEWGKKKKKHNQSQNHRKQLSLKVRMLHPGDFSSEILPLFSVQMAKPARVECWWPSGKTLQWNKQNQSWNAGGRFGQCVVPERWTSLKADIPQYRINCLFGFSPFFKCSTFKWGRKIAALTASMLASSSNWTGLI